MQKKIRLSSNIPINLPEKLAESNFGLGFLYPCRSGKGLELKEGQTWFEKVCLSLNKINSIVGFQNSNLKIPEYIAETISVVEKQLEQTSLLVRYNAQTRVNDIASSLSPAKTKVSFDDEISKSLTKGTPMVILGERSLRRMFPNFEKNYGLENKVKFILNHEIAHNIDCARDYKRGNYSIKDIMENHLGTRLEKDNLTSFRSNAELEQTKKMIKQIWTLSLEHYADVLGFLNMRNQLLEEGVPNKDINLMLDGVIQERQSNLSSNVKDFLDKLNSPLQSLITFEDRYKCINHFTVNALTELKEKLSQLGDNPLNIKEMEKITVEIVTKSDLKSLYIMQASDDKTSELLEKIFTTKPNEKSILVACESKKPLFIEKVKEIAGEDWVKEADKYIARNKDKKGLYGVANDLFGKSHNDLQVINQKAMNEKIQQVRFSFVKSFEVQAITRKNV